MKPKHSYLILMILIYILYIKLVPGYHELFPTLPVYPNNYEDHIKNMDHISETDSIKLPENTIYIDTSIPFTELKKIVIDLMC